MTDAQATPTPRSGPLAGMRVIEMANFLAGPLAAMALSDLGAEVIKIETAKGEPTRRLGRSHYPESPLFVNCNRGKRSVAVDLKDPADLAKVRVLLATADVMITNWRPGVTERLGLGDAALAAANPDLIRVYISGFGVDGPLADQPTYDAIVQAHLGSASGVAPDEVPTIASTFVVDKVSATMACQATLAAIVGRERGGGGSRVDISLLEAAAYANYADLMANRTFLEGSPEEAANTHSSATRPIAASDGWLIVVPVTAQQIRSAFAAVGAAEVGEEVVQIRDAARLAERMMDELEARTRTRTVAEWVEAFNAADVPHGVCLTIDQHLEHPQVRHNDNYRIADWPFLGRVRYARYPAHFSNWPELDEPTAPPRPGQDNDAVLGDLTAR
jgi:crotonobetainyl-CoA:carnitine CoA-transferase CaiB-like acyl-CoA transferase